jgi:hypothetical protein
VNTYLGKPVGYRPWPGRLALALLAGLRWAWQWGAILTIGLAALVAVGVVLGAIALLALLPYLLAAGPVTP